MPSGKLALAASTGMPSMLKAVAEVKAVMAPRTWAWAALVVLRVFAPSDCACHTPATAAVASCTRSVTPSASVLGTVVTPA